jgi:transposase
VGLVVTTDGLPLGYEIFDGNRTDVTTVEDIVEVMEAKYGRAERIWVMDRGMVSEDNLAYLRERGGRYIVGTPRSQLKDYEKELMGADWESVYEDLEVKVCASPDGQECFVLCRSAARQAKERAIHERFATRMEKGLLALHDRLAQAVKRPDRARVERQIGRLQERSSRAGRQYDIRLEDDPARPGHLRLSWTFDEALDSWVRLSEGAYLLRTNLTGYSPTEFWKMYMQLVDAEEAFRTLKSDLEIRPIYHQVRPRVHAHVLVAFLAYAMRKTLQQWMQASGLGRGVRTIVEELSQVQYCRVILPTKQGREIELSCVSQPTKHQQVLLQRLGLELPRRLGQPRWRNCVKLECKCSHDF